MNKMREVVLEKVTLNIGVGEAGEKLENAKRLLEKITEMKPVPTKARVRNPTFKIRQGDNIGAKVTLRGTKAEEVAKKALDTLDFKILTTCFDTSGNFSFGVKEYIDYPGLKYDPKIGMMGFDVCVTLKRRGYRIAKRRVARAKISQKHRVTKVEAIEFAKKQFGAKVEEPSEE